MPFKISEINPDRWHELDQLFQAAIDLEPERRPNFINAACRGDHILRAELEAYLNRMRAVEVFSKSRLCS